MAVNILVFGSLAEITGNKIAVTDVADTDALQSLLHRQYPALADMKYTIAVDKMLQNRNTPLTEHSEVALLPPFSGG